MKTYPVILLGLALVFSTQSVYALEFSLFGDITYRNSSETGTPDSFSLGQLDLFTEQAVSETSLITAEIVFEDPGNGFEVDIERLHIRKKLHDYFNIAGGRFHTPLGMWNTNFHHGSLIQDSINRPSFLEFEDAQQGIFPAHIVGLYIDGSGQNFKYKATVGNSPTLNTQIIGANNNIAEMEIRNSSDVNNDKTVVARLAFSSDSGQTEIGISAMQNKIAESGSFNIADPTNSAIINFGETLFDQQAVGIDFSHNSDRYYLFAEYFQLNTEDNPNITSATITPNTSDYESTAYYIQLGMRFTETLTTIYRHENLSTDETPNTYLNLLGIQPVTNNILGFNFKIEESHAIKFEIQRTEPEIGEPFTTISTQWFFLVI